MNPNIDVSPSKSKNGKINQNIRNGAKAIKNIEVTNINYLIINLNLKLKL